MNNTEAISVSRIIARLCQVSYIAGLDVTKELDALSLSTARSFPCLNKRPLFFVHIPKTAGASVHQFLDSQFDADDIFPGWNSPDLTHQRPDTLTYRLFRGHFTAGLRYVAKPDTELFTVLRSPEKQIYSFYAWMRHLDKGYWQVAKMATKNRNQTFKNRPGKDTQRLANSSIKAASKLNFKQFIQRADPLSRTFLDNLQMQMLSEFHKPNSPANKAHRGLIKFGGQVYRSKLATSARENLNHCIVTGVFEQLRLSQLVLCWKRGWAIPDTLPKIHSNSDRTVFRACDQSTRRLVQKIAGIDKRLYSTATTRLEKQWAELVREAGTTSINEWIDDSHCKRFFTNASPVYAVDISANKAWPGRGWGLREQNVHGQYWRWIGSSGKASLLMKLQPTTDYLLTVLVHTAIDLAVLDSLTAKVQGAKLYFSGRDNLDGCPVFRWLLSQDYVARCNGEVEIFFSIETRKPAKALAFSRVICHPW